MIIASNRLNAITWQAPKSGKIFPLERNLSGLTEARMEMEREIYTANKFAILDELATDWQQLRGFFRQDTSLQTPLASAANSIQSKISNKVKDLQAAVPVVTTPAVTTPGTPIGTTPQGGIIYGPPAAPAPITGDQVPVSPVQPAADGLHPPMYTPPQTVAPAKSSFMWVALLALGGIAAYIFTRKKR